MLGIVGNSRAKDRSVDIILSMTEQHQTVMMEAMLKYMPAEGSRRKVLAHEYEVIDTLRQQVRNREREKEEAFEHIEKLEEERKVMAAKLTELQLCNENLEKENKQLHNDLVAKIKSSNICLDIDPSNEEELSTEIENLKSKLLEKENETSRLKKDLEDERHRLEDELFIANQKALKLPGLEKLVEQQKAKLEELQRVYEERRILEGRLEVYELNIQELEKNKVKLLEDCKKLNAQLYSERNEHKEILASAKRNSEKLVKFESDIQALENKKKYWEQRARQSEEELQEARVEVDSLRLAGNAGSLSTQEQELSYKRTIASLENQLMLIKRNSGDELIIKIKELEGQLEAMTGVHKRKEEEYDTLVEKHDELQKCYKDTLEQLETQKISNANNEMLHQEYVRVKKNRDELLELVASSKETTAKYDELRELFAKSIEDYQTVKEELEGAKKQKAESDNRTLEYEKESAKLNERIAVLLEELDKSEKLIENLLKQSEEVSICSNR